MCGPLAERGPGACRVAGTEARSLSLASPLPHTGISRDNWHKRRKTGGKRKPYHKKRKYELGRPAANTKVGAVIGGRLSERSVWEAGHRTCPRAEGSPGEHRVGAPALMGICWGPGLVGRLGVGSFCISPVTLGPFYFLCLRVLAFIFYFILFWR